MKFTSEEVGETYPTRLKATGDRRVPAGSRLKRLLGRRSTIGGAIMNPGFQKFFQLT